MIGQEDCLYLNIYTPKLPDYTKTSDLMNVVVFIHGGAFISGQGSIYGPQYLLDSNNFVFVTINYRLGVLGFASTGDHVIPGNNGLKDQVSALKWIQRNIKVFGGDPDSVTITGMSAGASSVHYHLISPMSRGLFNRAILQSGSAFCNWAYTENVVQKTKFVANILGCQTNNSMDIVRCLLSRPGKSIAESVSYFTQWKGNPFTPFGPTLEFEGEEKFLPDIPEKLVPYDIPVLVSTTQDEGLIFIALKEFIDELNSNWDECIPHLLDYNYTISNEYLKTKVAQDIKKFYFGDQMVSTKTMSNIIKMISDRLFGYAISNAAQHIASKNSASVYFHEFGYSGNYSILADINPNFDSRGSGVCHGDETMYVISMAGKNVHRNEKDTNMMKTMVTIWASFIKNGKPYIGDKVNWLPVSKNFRDPLRYIKITQNQTFEVKEQQNHGNLLFWNSLPLNEFDLINMKEDRRHIEL
uniref:Carboxylic ester hydrolase n=1 Tax=Sipha flava TaxID=143950 RepID=A0A2S2QZ43_9HEMI